MFAGHIGAALAIGRAEPRVNVGVFVLAALCLLVLAFTIAGMTVAPPPPSAQAMASSSVVTILVVCALAYWLGRPRAATPS